MRHQLILPSISWLPSCLAQLPTPPTPGLTYVAHHLPPAACPRICVIRCRCHTPRWRRGRGLVPAAPRGAPRPARLIPGLYDPKCEGARSASPWPTMMGGAGGAGGDLVTVRMTINTRVTRRPQCHPAPTAPPTSPTCLPPSRPHYIAAVRQPDRSPRHAAVCIREEGMRG